MLGGALAACGSARPSSDGVTATTAAGTAPTDGTYPREVAGAVGTTLINTRPERVVAATDGAELASLLALGVTPVGFGQRNDPLEPWILEAGGDDERIQRYELAGEANFEVMASWRPDYLGQLNDHSPIGALLTEMGLPTLAPQVEAGEAADEIVAERMGEALADADAVVVIDFEGPEGDGEAVLTEQQLYTASRAVSQGRVVRLGVDESNAAYFDSVLTVRRNLELIERVLSDLA